MPTEIEIKAKHKQLHDGLSASYYGGTSGLTKEEFDQQHSQIWTGLRAELETIKVFTDEELYQGQLAEEFNSKHEQAILALKNWGSLTLAQKDTILKNLVMWVLWKDGWLNLETGL